jgi:GTPase SAR1 family protein
LTALQTLDLSKTQIKNGIQLTNILLSLPALKEVDTQGIKFQDIPNQIHGLNWKFNSLPNLRAWVTDLEKGTHKNRTHKLQIVGNGTVGKTTIANRLLTGTYREPDQSTDGIQVRFSPPQDYLRTNDPINLIVWDFAGQDIYHQMHRQFLRSESVVLLVYDEESINQPTQADRKTGQADLNRSLSYWAQDIMATSPDSEVFLVQNKMDRPGAQAVNVENYLPKDFNYRGPYKISARAGGRPFDRLLEDIHDHITGTKDYKMAIPHSWHLVRQNLLDRTADDSRTTLSVANFSTLCAASKLSANSESALLTYLDGLGIIIYDAELFPDELVLNPQWALDGVYSALQRPDISNIATQTPDQLRHNLALIAFDAEVKKNNGQYLPTQLPFNHSIYDPAARTLFHQIMRRAGTCFQTNDKQDGTPVYVLFHSLPTEETAAAKNAWNNCCSPYATVLFQRYHHPYHLHRGIFRQLVKQINDHVQLDHLWQDGLFLNYQNETFARLTTNYDQNANYIEVAATGPSAAAALQAFRNQLNQIITAEETFQLQVSTNATTWFPLANIDEGRQAEARAIKDTTGTYQKGWEPLAVWALASKPEITFKELPQVAHAAHDTLIASPTETALPLDLDQITATFLQRIEELQASNPGTQITLNVNVGDHYDNRAATMRNLVAGAKVNGSVNFVSPNEEIPS